MAGRKVRATAAGKALPCRSGWFEASTLVLLHRVAAGRSKSAGTGGLSKSLTLEDPPSLNLKTSATVHHHGGDLAIDDLLFLVKVEHVDGRHLGGGAARARGSSGVGLVDQVGMRVFLQMHVLTLPGAIVGLVALGGYNPVPAKVFKVHRERVAAATGLWRVLITVQSQVPPDTPGPLRDLHLHERLLKRQNACE